MKTLNEQMALVQSLNVIDDVFFQKIAEDREVCEEMLRIILEQPGLKVIQCQVQRFLRNNGAHSVVLDALCEMDDGSMANIEVQKLWKAFHNFCYAKLIVMLRATSSFLYCKKTGSNFFT